MLRRTLSASELARQQHAFARLSRVGLSPTGSVPPSPHDHRPPAWSAACDPHGGLFLLVRSPPRLFDPQSSLSLQHPRFARMRAGPRMAGGCGCRLVHVWLLRRALHALGTLGYSAGDAARHAPVCWGSALAPDRLRLFGCLCLWRRRRRWKALKLTQQIAELTKYFQPPAPSCSPCGSTPCSFTTRGSGARGGVLQTRADRNVPCLGTVKARRRRSK